MRKQRWRACAAMLATALAIAGCSSEPDMSPDSALGREYRDKAQEISRISTMPQGGGQPANPYAGSNYPGAR